MTTPNCKGMDTDIFYEQSKWSECKKICKGCPIIDQCRLDFLEDEFAYAGGMSPWQRREWRLNQPGMRKPRTKESNKPVTEATRSEVVRLFDEEDLSQGDIAVRTGISKSQARRILHASGRVRTREQQMDLSRRRGEQTREWILKLLAEDYTTQEIADKIGITYRHVAEIRRHHVLDQGSK